MLGHWWKGTLGPPQLVLMPVDKARPLVPGPQLGPGCTWCVTAGERWARLGLSGKTEWERHNVGH